MVDRKFDITLDPAVGFRIADLIREFDSEDLILLAQDDGVDDTVEEDDQPGEEGDPEMVDPFDTELTTLIDQLNVDAQRDLLALIWVGRGDYEAEHWADARRLASETRHLHVAQYLKETPLASNYLVDGLLHLGYEQPE